MFWPRSSRLLGISILLCALFPVNAVHAAAPDKTADLTGSPAEVASVEPTEVAPKQRDEVLGKDWQKSSDVAWTTSGDSDGLHVLVARAKDGYAWRTITTLSEPGFDVDQWIGNACLTGSGKRLVVVYAPRTFTNKADLFDRGGYSATVDLETGAVTKLPVQATLAYYNPGCGTGETAVLTQEGAESLGRTRLVEVDAAAGRLGNKIEVKGQLTSAVPTANGIVAADRGAVVTVDAKGDRRVLAQASTVPFHLKPDASGGVVFLDRDGETSYVRRVGKVAKGSQEVSTLAKGPLTELSLASTATGRVVITGKTDEVRELPAVVSKMDVLKDSAVSSTGQLAITSVQHAKSGNADPRAARPVRIEARVAATGKQAAFTVAPSGAGSPSGRAKHPKLGGPADGEMGSSGSPNTPLDPNEQVCGIARNDSTLQVYQPTARQVEWAVDYAVTNGLQSPHLVRPAGWKNSGMTSSWTPQGPTGLFPTIPLAGPAGGAVPPQVMLGIIAQESNMWQAARFALPGVPANPLIGNFYGNNIYNNSPTDDFDINWAKADCGYGVTQITDGMRKAGRTKPGEIALPEQTQRAVATDFATNVAAGLQILQKKWNETRNAGLIANDGDPRYLENWYFAVWAYNSGFNPRTNASAPWGVGWANNPANPHYPPNRKAFLETSYADAAKPQLWSYPEKVMGWAGHPIESVESPGKLVHGYIPASWIGWREGVDKPIPGKPSAEQNRRDVKPPTYLFCEMIMNDCDRNASVVPNKPDNPNTPEDESTIGEPAGPCTHMDTLGYYDLKCWWHVPATWKADCDYQCARETNRFRDPDVGYQPDGISYKPNCSSSGLPSAYIVDNVPKTTTPHNTAQRPCDANAVRNDGTFSLDFAADAQGRHPSKLDFHQLGAGYGGHFWFAHSWRPDWPDFGQKMRVTGTWTLNRPLNGWARVLVHMPDHGAHTQQAKYEINRGSGTFDKYRHLSQGTEQNKWVSLGVYQFSGTPQVRLSNHTKDGWGREDVAWDAIAFQPLAAKPRHMVAVLGDSFSSGEGAGDYYRETDNNHGTYEWAACRRSRNAWARQIVLPGATNRLGQLADTFAENAELGFVACSGAKTWNVEGSGEPESWWTPSRWVYGEGQFREAAQIDSGVLDENTTLVALTLGGNDRNAFARAVAACSTYPTDCDVAEPTFENDYKAILDSNASNVQWTVRQIALKAPNAKVVLMGYPKLLSETAQCDGVGLLSLAETRLLNRLATHFSNAQKSQIESLAAQGYKVHFAESITEFTGHGACDQAAWVHGVRVGANGEGDFHEGDIPWVACLPKIEAPDQCLSRESFHPNVPGANGYTMVLQRRLGQIGYTGNVN